MDTRFWGPSGWRLLHSIAFTYDPENKKAVESLFTNLPYVLPCKFCRASLTEYMEEDPLEPALESRESVSKWLWRIHNKVNDKLRKQGLLKTANPSFAAVKAMYVDCGKDKFEGWEFLFSIAENHPYSRAAKHSTPLPFGKCEEKSVCDKDKNRWNTMTPEERFRKYENFWKAVGPSLPYEEWRQAWKGACKFDTTTLEKRMSLLKELWRIRCCMEKNLNFVNRDEFQSLCLRLKDHRSGCEKKKKRKTCRKSRNSRASTT